MLLRIALCARHSRCLLSIKYSASRWIRFDGSGLFLMLTGAQCSAPPHARTWLCSPAAPHKCVLQPRGPDRGATMPTDAPTAAGICSTLPNIASHPLSFSASTSQLTVPAACHLILYTSYVCIFLTLCQSDTVGCAQTQSPYPTLNYSGGATAPPPSAYASPSVAAPVDRPIGQDSSGHGGPRPGVDEAEPDPMFLCPITQVHAHSLPCTAHPMACQQIMGNCACLKGHEESSSCPVIDILECSR